MLLSTLLSDQIAESLRDSILDGTLAAGTKLAEEEIATRLGTSVGLLHVAAPRVAQILMNTTFRMFPDSAAAKGDKSAKPTLSPEAIAMASMMQGIHF